MEDLKPVIGNVNGEKDLAKTQLKVRLHNELLSSLFGLPLVVMVLLQSSEYSFRSCY